MIGASDKVAICNQALAHLGVASISAMDEATDRARHCNAILEQLILELLTEHNWNFTTYMSGELARHLDDATEETPPFEYDYAYTIPSEWTVLALYQEDSPSTYPWALRLNADKDEFILMTDQDDDVYVKYAYLSGTVKAQYSHLFWKVIRLRLASVLAIALKGNTQLGGYFEDLAARAFNELMRQDTIWGDTEGDSTRPSCTWQTAGRGDS